MKLNAPLGPGERVAQYWFKLTPEGSQVVYGVQPSDQFDSCDLIRVGIDGSPSPVRLAEDVLAGPEIVYGYQFTPEGRQVLFRADLDHDGALDLYVSPIARPGKIVQLTNGRVPTSVEMFRVSRDGSRVVYRATSFGSSRKALYMVRIDGSTTPVKLDEGINIRPDFLISPRGDRVVYHVGLDYTLFGFHPGLLRSVSIKGGPPVTLDRGSVEEFFTLSDDGKRAVFRATRDNPMVIELYSVALDGSAPPVKLNDPFLEHDF